jgi:cell division protein FtsN
MARDYKNSYRKPTPKKARWPFIVPVILFLAVAGGIYAMYLHKQANSTSHQTWTAWMADIKSRWQNRHPVKSRPLTLAEKEQQKNEVHFDFYTELPKMQVGVPEVSEPKSEHKSAAVTPPSQGAAVSPSAAQSTKPAKPASPYVVQVATFKDMARAGELRISLLLAGIEANIVKIQEGDQTVYSVQLGPYASAALAKASQRRLQEKGFASVVH